MLPYPLRKLAVALALLNILASAGAGADVVQREVVRFPAAGAVRVEAIEKVGATPRIVLTQQSTGRQLLVAQFGADHPDFFRVLDRRLAISPKARFRALQEDGLPAPLLLAAAIAPGGSDCGYETNVIGEVGGQLKVLTPKPIFTNAEGGVYVGDLGPRGAGLVWWNFLWNDGSHPDPHEYEAEILRFDSKKGEFERTQWMTSRRKYYCGEDFLLRLGMRCHNMLRILPDFGC